MTKTLTLYYAKDIMKLTRKTERTAYRIIARIRQGAGMPPGPVVTNVQLAEYLGVPVEHLVQ